MFSSSSAQTVRACTADQVTPRLVTRLTPAKRRQAWVTRIVFNLFGGLLMFSLFNMHDSDNVWGRVDGALFAFLDRLTTDNHPFFVGFATLANSSYADVMLLLVVGALLYWAARQDDSPVAGRKWTGIVLMMLMVDLLALLVSYFALPTNNQNSFNLLILIDNFGDVLSLPAPYHARALASGNGLFLMVFAAFMWRYAAKKPAFLSQLIVVVISILRLLAGLYWFSDVYGTSLALACVLLPWLLCSSWCEGALVYLANCLGRPSYGHGIPDKRAASLSALARVPAFQLNPSYWRVLATTQRAFRRLDDSFSLQGVPITQDRISRVVRCYLGERHFYIKCYNLAGKHLQNWLGVPRIQREWENLLYFQALGLPTPLLVAFGKKRHWGRFDRGVLVTQEVQASRDLANLAASEAWPSLPYRWRVDVANQVMDGVARLHEQGFCHGDLYWRNLLVRGMRQPTVYFFDCPAGRFWWGAFLNYRRIKDLASLDKTACIYLSASERMRCYLRYKGLSVLTPQAKAEIRKVLFYNRRKAD